MASAVRARSRALLSISNAKSSAPITGTPAKIASLNPIRRRPLSMNFAPARGLWIMNGFTLAKFSARNRLKRSTCARDPLSAEGSRAHKKSSPL
jgi:hypothetical protein